MLHTMEDLLKLYYLKCLNKYLNFNVINYITYIKLSLKKYNSYI